MSKWNFPNCLGALDGKHIAIKALKHSGSMFFNYKGFFSIVLLALVDTDCKFTFVDVGSNGRISDGGVLRESCLQAALNSNSFGIPPATSLPERNTPVPYVIVADEASPLKENLMKPFPAKLLEDASRVFNYRLSRARRVSEKCFWNSSPQISNLSVNHSTWAKKSWVNCASMYCITQLSSHKECWV